MDQSDREVSPKLIVGNKKYGRRSVPQSIIDTDTSDDSEDEKDMERFSRSMQKTQSVIRSCSQSDIARRRGATTASSKLKRCASLPAQKNLRTRFQQKTVVEPIQKTSSAESLGKFNQIHLVILHAMFLSSSNFEKKNIDNIDFENLTNQIHSAWMGYGNEIGTHYFTKANLSVVFQKVGIVEKIAGKVAEEVFEKTPANAINLQQFIELIHGPNSDFEFDLLPANKDLCYENNGNTNSLTTLVDGDSERDFLFKGKTIFDNKCCG